jgi:hypothetical protein
MKVGYKKGKGPLYSGTVIAPLNYQNVIPGKHIGRYINQEDKGDMADVHEIVHLPIRDARALKTPAKLTTKGF